MPDELLGRSIVNEGGTKGGNRLLKERCLSYKASLIRILAASATRPLQ